MKDFHAIEMELRDAASGRPEAALTFKQMFGGLGAFADGRIFAAHAANGLALKLPPKEIERALSLGGVYMEYDLEGSKATSYVVLPHAIQIDPAQFRPWVERTIDYVLTLPPPKKKKSK